MQKALLSVVMILVFASCMEITSNKTPNISDSVNKLEEEITPDIKKLRQEYIHNYSKELQFEDSVAGKNNENLVITGKYYCLFDSAIVVPPKYNLDDTTKSFTTHNFAVDILIKSNGNTNIKKTITKKYFFEKLPQHLQNFGIILEPVFDNYDTDADIFYFRISISIPLTDVGQSMEFSLNRNGEVTAIKAN